MFARYIIAKFFASLNGLGLIPAGYESSYKAMEEAQDAAVAARSPAIASRYLQPDGRPLLFRDVKLYDSLGRRFVDHQSVLVSGAKIVSVGRAGSFATPSGTRIIDGVGKTLVPGLWDSHMHMGDDNAALSELAIGVTSYRDPGTEMAPTLSKRERRAAGKLLAPNAYPSIIIDGKNPLQAQGATIVTSEAETIAAVRNAAANGFNIKFYTSMNPAWIAPGAAEAHRLGLHVHGHIPATMRPLDAINAGYDEVTHINFVIMQAMPQDVVDHSNGKMRFEGPGKYAAGVDLDAEPMKGLIATMAKRHIAVDPTLVVYESLLTQEAGTMPRAYAPYVGTLPAATERGFKAGGYPLPADVTRATWRASFAKLGALVGKLHSAGVPIVAGTDGGGLELVRELELYVEAGGLTPAEALATATINTATLVGHGADTRSITAGKTADLLLVDGDPAARIGDLRHVDQVVLGGVLLDGDALRKDAGFAGKPH